VQDDDPPEETAALCYSTADHLINRHLHSLTQFGNVQTALRRTPPDLYDHVGVDEPQPDWRGRGLAAFTRTSLGIELGYFDEPPCQRAPTFRG
jgi:hypothetical protein